MIRIAKFVAVVASIAVFVMPAATMPLHCILKAPAGGSTHPCHMMGMSSSADQINAAPVNHSCCTVSAAKQESMTAPRVPAGSGIVAPKMAVAFLSDLPAVAAAYEPFDRDAQSPSGPPHAFLCTFLI
jgi:hypothetical protein